MNPLPWMPLDPVWIPGHHFWNGLHTEVLNARTNISRKLEASDEPSHDLILRWGSDLKTNPIKSVPELFETLLEEKNYASEMRASWGLLIFSDSKNMIQVD